VVVYFGQFLNYISSANFWLCTIFPSPIYVHIEFDNNGLGDILGDFFKNSSCHPAHIPSKKPAAIETIIVLYLSTSSVMAGLPDLSWHNIPKRENYNKGPQNLPKGP
jgi:hypothetical protein